MSLMYKKVIKLRKCTITVVELRTNKLTEDKHL